MTQHAIPFVFMRGGTSRGPYMRRADLPSDEEALKRVLVAMVGSGNPLNIDGIGGGNAVTTKTAMLSRSDDAWADIDYLFAQVGVEDGLVDLKPTCGNILVGVGPASIELGLMEPKGDVTEIRIRAVNTGARVLARVQTPNGGVAYAGTATIDGVPGTAAPVELNFMDVVGGATGSMFPTGNRTDNIDGIDVSCMDVAMPMVMARAEAFGLTGQESFADMEENRSFFAQMEAIRVEAGRRMGMGDVSASVTPKFGLFSPAQHGGSVSTRYLMPKTTHPSLAVTGSQCMACCLLCPGTVAAGLADLPDRGPVPVLLEHPMGVLEVVMDYRREGAAFEMISAGLVRTARKLAAGDVFVPGAVL
ncbi:MAG: 4-oxalomesaconate tautomerase [Pseudomonadota bacterium]